MTDRFTRGADEFDRHKGSRIGTIYDKNCDGDITLSPYFDSLLPLQKCDILQDAIGLLLREYKICIRELRGEDDR